jgi:hypothetical protein
VTSSLFRRWDATFDVLLREAARMHPYTSMSPERLSFARLDTLADHYAARWREALARLGDGAVLIAVPTAQSFAAIVGSLRAGLALSLAPPEIEAPGLDAAIVAANACILAGPVRYAGMSIGDLICRVAVDQESVSLVATHGAKMSGVLSLDGERERDTAFESRRVLAQIRIVQSDQGPVARFDESELIDAAGAIVLHAGIARGDSIVSTLSCASAAGLATGPLAALVAGARLTFHAPFDARVFLAMLEAAAPVHLVVPDTLARMLQAGGVLDTGLISSLILSCADETPAPTFTGALDNRPVLHVSMGAWGGLQVETSPRSRAHAGEHGEQDD